jgi:hypothetical protein
MLTLRTSRIARTALTVAGIGTTLAIANGAPAAAGVRTVSFSSLGGSDTYSWKVPANVAAITVEAYGGQGAGGLQAGLYEPPGGKGAYVRAELAVTPGMTLAVDVPFLVGATACFNGSEGGGGEAALVTQSGTDLVVAGGGGGSAPGMAADTTIPPAVGPIKGGAGGASGSPGSTGKSFLVGQLFGAPTPGAGGGGASKSSPGAGGTPGKSFDNYTGAVIHEARRGTAGSTLLGSDGCGGAGAIASNGGAGGFGGAGGGGYRSGGGGGGGGATALMNGPQAGAAAGGGGGGGSSYVEHGAKDILITQGIHSGMARLTISY